VLTGSGEVQDDEDYHDDEAGQEDELDYALAALM
jgi:hypothetical protein